jgi:hypothetical protein
LECQAQVLGQADNAAVLDSRFRLELKRGHHRPGINLRDTPFHAEFVTLCFNRPRTIFQLVFVQFLAALTFFE